jgi:peptidoglycan hydrolase-like protein with peptidoglycan-binding domain
VGCTGDDVKWLQAALKQLGFTITVDGIFGNGTKGTVIQFQRYNGLTQDGIVGPATRTALKNAVH